jgi:hypothetical protein
MPNDASLPNDQATAENAAKTGAAQRNHALNHERKANPLPQGIDKAVALGWIESRHLVFGGVMVFLLLLTLGFIYDWRKGVFRWR